MIYNLVMYFEIVGPIEGMEEIAVGGRIRDILRIQKLYGTGRWRKMKGYAGVRLVSGKIRKAEIHWYEAHGIGRKKFKIKKIIG